MKFNRSIKNVEKSVKLSVANIFLMKFLLEWRSGTLNSSQFDGPWGSWEFTIKNLISLFGLKEIEKKKDEWREKKDVRNIVDFKRLFVTWWKKNRMKRKNDVTSLSSFNWIEDEKKEYCYLYKMTFLPSK